MNPLVALRWVSLGFSATLHVASELVRQGIEPVLELPRSFELEYDPDYEADERRTQAAKRNLVYVDLGVRPRKGPLLRMIHLWVVATHKGAKALTHHFEVGINVATRKIDWSRTSRELFNAEHKHASMMVPMLVAPLTVMASLPILTAAGGYKLRERYHGISRHGSALLNALKGQLDAETEALLTDALRNSWEFEKRMKRKVTFDQAKQILAECTLVETDLSDVTPGEIEYRWFNADQDCVGQYKTWQGESSLTVLGSSFDAYEGIAQGYDPRELLRCFREKVREDSYDPVDEGESIAAPSA